MSKNKIFCISPLYIILNMLFLHIHVRKNPFWINWRFLFFLYIYIQSSVLLHSLIIPRIASGFQLRSVKIFYWHIETGTIRIRNTFQHTEKRRWRNTAAYQRDFSINPRWGCLLKVDFILWRNILIIINTTII